MIKSQINWNFVQNILICWAKFDRTLKYLGIKNIREFDTKVNDILYVVKYILYANKKKKNVFINDWKKIENIVQAINYVIFDMDQVYKLSYLISIMNGQNLYTSLKNVANFFPLPTPFLDQFWNKTLYWNVGAES